MRNISRMLVLCTALLAAACSVSEEKQAAAPETAGPAIAPVLTTPDAVDPHSFARPLEARVTHVKLDLAVDFETKSVGGTAMLDIDRKSGAKEIVLDDKGLVIASVADGEGQPLQWKKGPETPEIGAPLTIALGPETRRIAIRYKSAPGGGALQWLTPDQTAGKKAPFLFSQGQPIENRSWIPTQDSPGIRQTWDATIRVPAGLTVVMSAPRSSEPITQGGQTTFSFRMANPVAPYLIAIAVGDIAFRDLGKRSGVWAEPATLDAAAREFSDTEKFIDAAERILGPYRWGRYDMIVLPPAFPYGGMENPNMTFLTPTLLAGDKSQVSVVAHELAHSWSGNLATNATWNDFWLNEGFTTYAERRIVEAVFGKKALAQQTALALDTLDRDIADYGGPTGRDTHLVLDLKGRHPDDGTSEVAYEKGAAFLQMIEAAVGRERFDPWFRGYFERHAFKPVTSAIFLQDLRTHLIKGDVALERKLRVEDWLYGPGRPANLVPADPNAFAEVDRAVAAFKAGGKPDRTAWGTWNTDERLHYLGRLPSRLPVSRLDALQAEFALNDSRNSEILFAWLKMAVANRYDPAVPALERFLAAQGRGKFVRPLFKALSEQGDWGHPIARRVLAKSRALYHPLVLREVDKMDFGQGA